MTGVCLRADQADLATLAAIFGIAVAGAAKLPSSRGCAQDYAIADVVTFFPEGSGPVIAVLLYVITQGFEGPDRRFLAVTSGFAAH
jgi:predicted secreted protein